ncbi:hypothetical protein GWK48_07610 [Metallosphaera tengchongensis]|uniref:Uncharacterized protein n=1 Tax=Metallosphaera tengchongensis TaxID=1532350 RepID=A0A6N0NQM7_9CREN|nr:hypothetical protein [Metallosphaera tengchongensis]QKQ98991.1 hypothetical protein GWK48_07610 [Metallosphaera tengchongensis]
MSLRIAGVGELPILGYLKNLSCAAYDGFYTAGRDQQMKEYMEDVKKHQEEIMNTLNIKCEEFNKFIEDREFLEL